MTPELQLTLVETKKKYNLPRLQRIFFSFRRLFLFFLLIFPCFPKHIKFGQNFVTKNSKQKIETWRLVPMNGNKYLQNFSCQITRQEYGKLRCFKTKDSRHSKIKYSYINYIINFIHKFWNYCIATFDVIYRRRKIRTQSQETNSLETRAALIEIFMLCWNLQSGPKHWGWPYCFPWKYEQFCRWFSANLDETKAGMVQFTKRWN